MKTPTGLALPEVELGVLRATWVVGAEAKRRSDRSAEAYGAGGFRGMTRHAATERGMRPVT